MGKIVINMDSLKSSRDWVRHKVNEGDNIFRIMPPFGDLEQHKNYPYHRWSVAWLVDPKSNKRKPFATPLTDGDTCPVQEYNDALNLFIEERKNQLKSEGYSDGDVKVELEGLRNVQWNMRIQHVYAYNACNQAGSVGILELKSTAHKAMKKMMNVYIKEHGQDPTSLGSENDDSGVWFNILKEGKGKDTEYSVAFNQTKQKINGTLVKIDDRSALPDHVVDNYDSLAYDLGSIYVRKNYDELRTILMFNLGILAQEVPEAGLVPGFELEEAEEKVAPPARKSARPALVEDETPIKRAVAKVTLKLDDEDDEPAPARKAAAPVAAKPAVKAAAPVKKAPAPVQEFDDDELNALTNEILGD